MRLVPGLFWHHTCMKSRILADDSNDQLVARYANARDEAAFAELVRRFGPMVLGVSRRLLASHEDADDATQLVFAELARRAGTIEDPEAVAGWLHTITVRVAHRLRRRQPNTEPLVADPLDPRLSLEDLGQRSDLEVLSQELDQLPASWREPLLLRYFAGLSNEAVATQLGTTVTALEGRLKRGRNSLRVRLLRRGVGVAGVLSLVGPADLAFAGEHWEAVTDAAANLSSDPNTLTFLPGEPTSAALPIVTSKVVLATGAAAVILTVLGGGGELSNDSISAVSGTISTVAADDELQSPVLTNPIGVINPVVTNPVVDRDAAKGSDPQATVAREPFSFMLDNVGDLIAGRPPAKAWKSVIAGANKSLFEKHGVEIRYVEVDEDDGEVTIEVPADIDGVEAMFLKYVFKQGLRATAERLASDQQSLQSRADQLVRILDSTEDAINEQPNVPDWIREEMAKPLDSALEQRIAQNVPSLSWPRISPSDESSNDEPTESASLLPATEQGWQREFFISEDMDELIAGRRLDAVWKEIVEEANASLFRPHGAEVRFIGIDADGDAVIDYPKQLVGAGALIARSQHEQQKRAIAKTLATLENEFLERLQSQTMALQPPQWIRKALLRSFDGTDDSRRSNPRRSNPQRSIGMNDLAEETLLKAVASVAIGGPFAQTPRRLKQLDNEQADEFLRRLRETVQQQTSGWASVTVELGSVRQPKGDAVQSRYVTYTGTVHARTPGAAEAEKSRNAIGRLVWNSAERILDELNVSLVDVLTSPSVEDPLATSDDSFGPASQPAPVVQQQEPVLQPNHERTLDVFIDEESADESIAATIETTQSLFGQWRIKVFNINSRDGAHVAKYYGVRSAPAFLLLSPHLDKTHNEMVPETLYEQRLTTEEVVGLLMSNQPVSDAKNLARPDRFVPTQGVLVDVPNKVMNELDLAPAIASPEPLSNPTTKSPDKFPLSAAGLTDPNHPPNPAFWKQVIERFNAFAPSPGYVQFDMPSKPQAFMNVTRPWFNDDDPRATARFEADAALLHQAMMIELARDRRLLIDGKAISLADLIDDNATLQSRPLEQVLPQTVEEVPETAADSANDSIPLAEGRYMLWFTQPGCKVCEAMRPDIEQTKAAFDAGRVREFDITTPRGRALAKAYDVDVFATPTTVVTNTSPVSGVARAEVAHWGRLAVESLIPLLTTNRVITPGNATWATSGTAVPGREEHAESWKNAESLE